MEMGSLLAGPFRGQPLAGFGAEVRWTGPAFGQHDDEVYSGSSKLDEDERADLRERGIA